MQIFPTARLHTRSAIVLGGRAFRCAVLPGRAVPARFPGLGDAAASNPVGQVPRCPENACKRPYNQRLEGLRPSPPKRRVYLGARMKERGWIEPIVERVVGQVLDSHAAQLRTEIVRRVMEEIAAEPASAEPTAPNAASASVRQIWRAPLLKSSWAPRNGKFCARCSIPAPATRLESRSLSSRAAMPPDGRHAASPIATR